MYLELFDEAVNSKIADNAIFIYNEAEKELNIIKETEKNIISSIQKQIDQSILADLTVKNYQKSLDLFHNKKYSKSEFSLDRLKTEENFGRYDFCCEFHERLFDYWSGSAKVEVYKELDIKELEFCFLDRYIDSRVLKVEYETNLKILEDCLGVYEVDLWISQKDFEAKHAEKYGCFGSNCVLNELLFNKEYELFGAGYQLKEIRKFYFKNKLDKALGNFSDFRIF